MFGKFLGLDSPVVKFLSRLFDVFLVNLLDLMFCIPLFIVSYFTGELLNTSIVLLFVLLFVSALLIGPALTASHYICLKMVRDEDSYIVKGYFHSFKQNFLEALEIWAIYLFFFVLVLLELYVGYVGGEALLPQGMRMGLFLAVIILFATFLWVFPYLSHFTNTVLGSIKNAAIMTLAAFPRTLAMAAFAAIPVLLLYTQNQYVMPIVFLFGIAGPVYLSALVYSSFFKRFEPKEEKENPDKMLDVESDEFKEAVTELKKDYDKIS